LCRREPKIGATNARACRMREPIARHSTNRRSKWRKQQARQLREMIRFKRGQLHFCI
jgi:hypothetical protein